MLRFDKGLRALFINRAGFSLVELSIVLVILGLLTGGILAGQSLIHAAGLRSITVERDKYSTALSTFRDKYFQIPGDMNNAFQFWGTTCGTNDAVASTGCNGNGNGLVEDSNSTGENLKLWEHLARSGLIEGLYDGVGVIAVNYSVADTRNVPKSKFSSVYWEASHMVSMTSEYYSNIMGSAVENNLWLHFGSIASGSTGLQYATSLTRADAWNIDTKTDDGRANTGSMRGDGTADCFDMTTTDPYNLSSDSTAQDCILHFKIF